VSPETDPSSRASINAGISDTRPSRQAASTASIKGVGGYPNPQRKRSKLPRREREILDFTGS
jgi:hypothetical protein